MTAQTLISRYNHFNGKALSVSKLRSFHQDVQAFIDSVGRGPFVSDLKGILERTTAALKEAYGFDVIEKIELSPIDVNKTSGRILRVASGYEAKKKAEIKTVIKKVVEKPANLVAEEIATGKIFTDTKRFQNRQDAFSEASAASVAEHYDPNKFDPIVVWMDPKAKKLFVLSGHSRYEGMKRREAKTIAVRYFKGNESEAIQFAKVEANRGATQESLIEDLAAYRLMRDGDEGRKIKKSSKAELSKIFKGKVQKLEAYSHLAPGGLFVNALSQSNTSNYPYLERNAQWIGHLRKDNSVLNNSSEDNIFHFFYSDKTGKHLKLSKDEFFKLAQKRINQLGKNEHILFVECSGDGCVKINEKESDPVKGSAYKRLREVNETLESINEKLRSTDPKVRVSTQAERDYLVKDLAPKLQAEKEKIQNELNIADKQESLFGVKKKKANLSGKQYSMDSAGGGKKKKKATKGKLNKLQRQALQDSIKEGSTPRINQASKTTNKGWTDTPLFESKLKEQQTSLFGMKKKKKSVEGLPTSKPGAAMPGLPKTTGAVTAEQLAGLPFKEIELDGEWKTDLHRLFTDTQVMAWGSPGSGKTVKLIQLAQYLATKGLKVLYVANEEMGRSTFTIKMREFKFGHPNLLFEKELPEDLSYYDVIFLDSVQTLGMDLKMYKTFRIAHPDKLTVAIVQSTKDGDFQGGNSWEHEMDIAFQIVDRKIVMHKNRLDPEFAKKAERIRIDNMVDEKTKKAKIIQTVKNKMAPQPVPIVQQPQQHQV